LGINNYKLTNNIIGDIMNNIDVRKYIINNFKNDSMEEIAESINTSIESKSEDPLIGLGVLFEIMWNNSSNDLRNSILSNIKKGLN
jgi:small acid-soluble spore protein I (minor)